MAENYTPSRFKLFLCRVFGHADSVWKMRPQAVIDAEIAEKRALEARIWPGRRGKPPPMSPRQSPVTLACGRCGRRFDS